MEGLKNLREFFEDKEFVFFFDVCCFEEFGLVEDWIGGVVFVIFGIRVVGIEFVKEIYFY